LLGLANWRLLFEAALVLNFVRIGLRLLPFRIVRRALDGYATRLRTDHADRATDEVGDITHAVTAIGRRLPGTTTCLIDALAADAMLRRRGHASTLCFGVLPPRSRPRSLEAHAWIEYRGAVVLGAVDDLADFHRGQG